MEQKYERCAYHPTQRLITFCKDKKCFLPLCQVCEKVHTSQHKMSSTLPQFEKLSHVFAQVNKNMKTYQNQYSNLISQITRIQQAKRRQSTDLKQIFKRKRSALIKQFQSHLIDLQELFLKNLAEEQKQFINKIQDVDRELCSIHQNLIELLIQLNKKENSQEKFTSFTQKVKTKSSPFYSVAKKVNLGIQSLSSPSCLKVLIEYLSGNHEQFYQLNLLNLKQKVNQIRQDKIELVTLQSQPVQRMKQAIIEYFTIYKCTLTSPQSNRLKLIQNY